MAAVASKQYQCYYCSKQFGTAKSLGQHARDTGHWEGDEHDFRAHIDDLFARAESSRSDSDSYTSDDKFDSSDEVTASTSDDDSGSTFSGESGQESDSGSEQSKDPDQSGLDEYESESEPERVARRSPKRAGRRSERTRYSAKFSCNECNRSWHSEGVFRRKSGGFYGQKCKACETICTPTDIQLGSEGGKRRTRSRKPHDSARCERCCTGKRCVFPQ